MFAPALRVLALVATAHALDQTQLERYAEQGRLRRYQLDVPGKNPITIFENEPTARPRPASEWIDITLNNDKDRDAMRNIMTDIIHDTSRDTPRCYGPSCQEGFVEELGPQGNLEEYLSEYADKMKDYRDFSNDRLQAISALATKLKNERLKVDYFTQAYPGSATPAEEDNSGKVYTAWNRLKVKKHKHPYDDKDGWVTLEPVAWSTSKISKWKPNIKKQKPISWNEDEERYPGISNDGYYQASESAPSYPQPPHKKPSVIRPAYINNKLHMSTTTDWDAEVPSRPSWNKPQAQGTFNYPSSWSPDDGRRPQKPTCDTDEHHTNDDSVYYGISDSVVTDNRPSKFPYEYEALKRPLQRPTQVVYAGTPELDNDRTTRPSFGQDNGQWVLLSTTKGYRNKKRQRSLFGVSDEGLNPNQATITSHQAVSLTVLPADSSTTNMTTSHGGLLEVERSFKTVEESKRDMDNEFRPDPIPEASVSRPVTKLVQRRVVGAGAAPDGAAVLAAVSAGMVPATMAMVVPMMIGRRRRRDLAATRDQTPFQNTYF